MACCSLWTQVSFKNFIGAFEDSFSYTLSFILLFLGINCKFSTFLTLRLITLYMNPLSELSHATKKKLSFSVVFLQIFFQFLCLYLFFALGRKQRGMRLSLAKEPPLKTQLILLPFNEFIIKKM